MIDYFAHAQDQLGQLQQLEGQCIENRAVKFGLRQHGGSDVLLLSNHDSLRLNIEDGSLDMHKQYELLLSLLLSRRSP